MIEIEPDIITWISILSPCRHFGNLEVAQEVFELIKTIECNDEDMSVAYVLMADVYKKCGQESASNDLHKERLDKGLFKKRGAGKKKVLQYMLLL